MTRPTHQTRVVGLAIVILAVVIGAAVDASFGASASDRLTSSDVPVDPRIVVVRFDTRVDGTSAEVAYLRATVYRDVARLASVGGARAVGFVDFNSLSFSDGTGGRDNVVASAAMQSLAVIPLLDTNVATSRSGRIPLLRSYRVDPLASEVAGIGVPLAQHGGVVRTVPTVARAATLGDGVIVNTLDLRLKAADRDSNVVVPGLALRLVELGTGAAVTDPTTSSVEVGGRAVPLEDGAMRVRWSDRLNDVDDATVISDRELDTAPKDIFADAIVLVGTTDPTNTNYVDTPVGRMPAVLAYANAVNTLLRHDPPRPVSSGWAALCAIAASVAVMAVPRRRRWLPAVVAVGGSLVWLAAVHVLADAGRLVAPLTVPAAAIATVLLLAARAQWTALAERRRLRTLFAQYVPASVAAELASSGRGAVASQGERVSVTTLFCDLRGFTPLAAGLQPGRVRELLDTYYEVLGQTVFDAGGTVMQFTGDEIFAVFGAPVPVADHADAALRCARDMFAERHALNRSLDALGLPSLNFGIGLHSGTVVAAHVGSSVHRQYAVIGDTVNIGHRHCALAREGQIAISATTAARIDLPSDAELRDDVEIRGAEGVHSIYVVQAGLATLSGHHDGTAPSVESDARWMPSAVAAEHSFAAGDGVD